LTGDAGDELAPNALTVADFDYELPPHLIAQRPLPQRDRSRLLVLDRTTGAITHSTIDRLPEWLAAGDLLVANNSRVIPARLRGFREPGGGKVELLLLREEAGVWAALAKPAGRLRPGAALRFPARDGSSAPAVVEVEENLGGGEVRVRFADGADRRLEDYGETPLPPYITEELADGERYQTIYASIPGSAAAPTAGLHFTPSLLDALQARGVSWAEVTLHVGIDTFRPVTVDAIDAHRIHREWCEVSDEVANRIAATRRAGGRVFAVGTTAARTLETLGGTWRDDTPGGFRGFSDVFIVPRHRWQLVDGLLTNFHLPRSTLLMMVSALAGREAILNAYREAIEREYRFYSFGDAMLIR
jgi:S-adenosylmethionine:tRNA ribosyltransferase-isomerase